MLIRMSDDAEPGPQPSAPVRADSDEAAIASWPACAAIAVLLVALFFSLPHV